MTAQAGLFVARDSGGNGTTPRGARLAVAGLLATNADGTVRTGVLYDGLASVVTGAAGMSYNVRPHVAVTKATDANGPVLVPNDGTVNVTTDPAPGSNSRIDIIYLWQKLVTGDGGAETTNSPVFGVAVGAASASPSAPAIPSGALELARATVTSGTTATSGLTFTHAPWTVAAGAPVPVRSAGERTALAFAGSQVVRLDAGSAIERYDGTSWSGGGWQTWSGSGSGFGSGVTFSGKYQQIGKTVRARGLITTSANGITGTATWLLPVTPHADYAAGEIAIGSAQLRGGSSANRVGGTVAIAGLSMFFLADRATTQTVGAGIPFTWANGYTIGFTVEYEAA